MSPAVPVINSNQGVEMIEPMKDPSQLPGHEQAAAFRVGAMLATQSIAVYVEPEEPGGPYGPPTAFDALPVRLRIRILEACENEFRSRRRELIKNSLAVGDPTVADVMES